MCNSVCCTFSAKATKIVQQFSNIDELPKCSNYLWFRVGRTPRSPSQQGLCRLCAISAQRFPRLAPLTTTTNSQQTLREESLNTLADLLMELSVRYTAHFFDLSVLKLWETSLILCTYILNQHQGSRVRLFFRLFQRKLGDLDLLIICGYNFITYSC